MSQPNTLRSRLPDVGTSIFTVMSAMARAHGAVNLAQGFPDFDCDEGLQDLVHHYMRKGYNQYAPMAGVPALREAIARKIEATQGVAVDPDAEITVTAGATEALFVAISAVVHPGDEVIILEPAYDSYAPVVRLNGGRVVPVGLRPPAYRVDWGEVAAVCTPRTRLIIVNNPHNPTGQIFAEADLMALEELAERHDLWVLSDEVYEHIVFDGQRHHSVLSRPRLRQRSFAAFSFGKTYHNTGWKMGYCVASPSLTEEFRKIHQFVVFSVHTPVQHALATWLEKAEHWESLAPFFQKKRDLLQQALADTPLRPLPCAGTYFQLYDYSAASDLPDVEFVRWLATEKGVATIPVSPFYSDGYDARVVRICFAKKEDTLREAAALLRRAFAPEKG